jgi:hypothetical protein
MHNQPQDEIQYLPSEGEFLYHYFVGIIFGLGGTVI